MCRFILFTLSLFSVLFALTNCTSSYDQRQTGSLNVQIGLKNIQLIALLKGGKEDYVDYDYAYDYSEMTIKPQGGTTSKPLNATTTPTAPTQNNVTTSLPVEAENFTKPNNIDMEQSMNSTEVLNSTASMNLPDSDIKVKINATVLNVNTTEPITNSTINSAYTITNHTVITEYPNYSNNTSTEKVTADVPTTESPDLPNKVNTTIPVSTSHCRRGFVQNHEGKCEYKVHGTTNALRRIVKLAQRIKIGRGYTDT